MPRNGVLFSVLVLLGAAVLTAEDEYKLREAAQYVKDRGGSEIPHVATSAHFALKWGDKDLDKFKVNDEYVKKALAYFEEIRAVYKDEVGLPFIKSEAEKYKINIYITRTGLKPFLEGYAFGFPDTEGYGVFCADPSVMTPGHGAAAHELGHATQGESGNFRDSDYVGWFWECHAQFMMQQVCKARLLPESLDLYCDMSRFDWSTAVNWHQYSGWIFLQYLKEKPGYGYPFINSLWTTKAVYQDEDCVNKMMRLKPLDGPAWSDLFGDYAKRNVTFASYEHGKAYKASLDKVAVHNERVLARWMAPLEPIKGRPGWFAMPYAGAPHQNGYNVIPLTPTAPEIAIEFNGLVDEERKSDGRATIVVVNEKGEERFSETARSGAKMDVRLAPTEKQAYLVVSATPHVFKHIKFLEDYRTQERFPYEVKITGADPRGKGPDRLPSAAAKGTAHPNGGGFVAETAKVAETAFVGSEARVLGKAQVTGTARIEDCAVVTGSATISGNAIVSGHAFVTGNAAVTDNARVRDYARVYDKAVIGGNAKVFEYARVEGNARLSENVVARGSCTVANSEIRGTAYFTGASNPGNIKNCSKGIYTIYVNEEDCKKAADMGGLFARYDFDKPNNLLLIDQIATGNGIIRGRPLWMESAGHGKALSFDGKDQCVELPRSISDLRNAEVSIRVNWAGGAVGQHVLDFGRDTANCLYLTPKSESGKPALVLVRNGKSETIAAESPLPVNTWCKLTVTFNPGSATLAVDDAIVGKGPMTAYPEDLRSDSNYLARGQDGGFFHGVLDDLSVKLLP